MRNGNRGSGAGGGSHFKYVRDAFGPRPIKLNHLTICIDFKEHTVEAVNTLDMTAMEGLEEIVLDAKGA